MADDPTKHTSQVAHVGDVVKTWMDELVSENQDFAGTGMPIVVYGPTDNASNAAPPSITWCPTSENIQPPQRQGAPTRAGAPSGPGALFVRGIPISFELCGGMPPANSYAEEDAPFVDCKMTEILYSKLVNTIHRTVSENGYAIEAVNWFNGGRTGIGMSCEVVVQVRLPLIREDNPTVKVQNAHVHTEFAPHE